MNRDETEATFEGYTYDQAANRMDALVETVTALKAAKDCLADLGRKADFELIADMESEIADDILEMGRVIIGCKKIEEAVQHV